jgi:hypothetical protein
MAVWKLNEARADVAWLSEASAGGERAGLG